MTALLIAVLLTACGGAQDETGGTMDAGDGMVADSAQMDGSMGSGMEQSDAMDDSSMDDSMENGSSMSGDTVEMRRP